MKQPIASAGAPAALGPYSQGIKAGGFLFLAGQAGLDPTSGQLVSGGIRAETERALKNLQSVVEAAGSSMAAVVRTSVYLTDLNDFAAMNETFARFFPQPFPARTTVEVRRLPKDAKVEIDLMALLEG